MIAHLYVRVSKDRQARLGVSLGAQEATLRAYCEQKGFTVAAVHAEPNDDEGRKKGRSGKKMTNRPGLLAALAAVKRDKGILCVYSLSRLTRSIKDLIDIFEQLQKAGADLASTTESFDTTSSMGRFAFKLFGLVAELERELISERTAEALAHKQAIGEKCGGRVPFGYVAVDTGKRKTDDEGRERVIRSLIPSEDEQATIRLILRECAGGKRFSACARLLNERRVPTRVGGCWKESVVSKIYRREAKQQQGALT